MPTCIIHLHVQHTQHNVDSEFTYTRVNVPQSSQGMSWEAHTRCHQCPAPKDDCKFESNIPKSVYWWERNEYSQVNMYMYKEEIAH